MGYVRLSLAFVACCARCKSPGEPASSIEKAVRNAMLMQKWRKVDDVLVCKDCLIDAEAPGVVRITKKVRAA